MLGIKGFICIGILITELVGLLYIFCNYSFHEILKAKDLPITFYIFCIVLTGITLLIFYQKKICYYFNALLDKYCIPEAKLKDCSKNENIEKLQENILIPQKESTISVQEIKNTALKKTDEEIDKIFEHLEKHKYELVISQVQEKLKILTNEKSEFLYRFILYHAYIEYSNDQYLADIIDNIKKFIPLVKKYTPKELYLYLDVRYNLMVAYARQNDFQSIKKENYSLIKEIRKDLKIPAEVKYRCYNMQGIVYLKENNIPYAMGYFDKALEYCENDFDILFNMALTYYYIGNDINKCMEYIDRIDPSQICDNEERYRLFISIQCYCLALKKDYAKAYEIADNYLFNDNSCCDMKAKKAYIAYKLNKFDEAKQLSDDVLSSVTDATATNVRGMLQLHTGKYEEAYQNFKNIISEFIGGDKYFLGEIYYHCSYACLRLNKLEEAFDYFQKSKKTKYNDYDPDYIIDLDILQQEKNIIKGTTTESVREKMPIEN